LDFSSLFIVNNKYSCNLPIIPVNLYVMAINEKHGTIGV
jgi:hypothetical protein